MQFTENNNINNIEKYNNSGFKLATGHIGHNQFTSVGPGDYTINEPKIIE